MILSKILLLVLFELSEHLAALHVMPVHYDILAPGPYTALTVYKDRTVITRHINNIFKDGELDEKSNVQKMHFANSDRPVALSNLDVIISVGYRVKSKRGIIFRKWANKVINNYSNEFFK